MTSAVESVDDAVLEKLEKGHTRADFIEVVRDFRSAGLTLAPTFIPFTPWTTRAVASRTARAAGGAGSGGARRAHPACAAAADSARVAIAGARATIQAVVTGFDEAALLYRWKHPDPEIDELAEQALKLAARDGSRREIFRKMWESGGRAGRCRTISI